jgi:5'-nucleotidase/UDP-sugar diphosphatase
LLSIVCVSSSPSVRFATSRIVSTRWFLLLATAGLALGCGATNAPAPRELQLEEEQDPARASGAEAATPIDAGRTDDDVADAALTEDADSLLGDPRWPRCDPKATSQDLTFVHVNDLHASYQLDGNGISPYSRIRGFYKSVRAESPYTVFTSGGDEYEKGALAEVLSEGASTLAILGAMAFDVRVIGNHDYAWNEDQLLRMSHDARASVLESNVRYEGSSTVGFGATSFVTLRIGCLRVGFAGLVSEPWDDQNEEVKESFYPDLPADYDFAAQAQKIVSAHRADVDVLVFVDHIGLTVDKLLAASVPGIDVILSAHSHELTATPVMVGDTVIIQTGAFAAHVARLDLSYDFAARKLTVAGYVVQDVDATLPPDTAMADTIADVLTEYAPHADDVVAFASAVGTERSIAMVAATAAQTKLGTDAAVVDTATVTGPWNAGSLSDQQMLDAFQIERQLPGSPGMSSFYTATVTGAGLEAIRARLGTRFVAVLPPRIVADGKYTLALQKRPAYRPETWFPGLVLADVAFGSEAWEAIDFYGQKRTEACLYLDVDTALPTCP